MNEMVLKVLAHLPWFKIAQWLLAETGWQRDVATWLAAENAWYFKLLGEAWGSATANPPTREELLAAVTAGQLKP